MCTKFSETFLEAFIKFTGSVQIKGVIIKIPSNKFVLLVQVPAAVPPFVPFVSENNGATNIMSNVPSVGSAKQNDNQELFFSDI